MCSVYPTKHINALPCLRFMSTEPWVRLWVSFLGLNTLTRQYICWRLNMWINGRRKCYRHASTRLEHLKREDYPLVVRAQQRPDVFAWRVAQSLRHAGPAPLLTDHLEASFICHNLKSASLAERLLHLNTHLDILPLVKQTQTARTFDKPKRSRMRLSMCGIFNDDAWISQNLAMRSK